MKRKPTTKMKRTRFGNKHRNIPVPAKYLPEVQDMNELVFAHEYLTDFDPVGAAIRTGMVSMRLKPDEQETQAIQIFNRTRVQAHIKKAMQERMVSIGITKDKILCELSNIAFLDPMELKDPYGDWKQLEDIRPEVRRCIQELKYQVHYKIVDGKKVAVGHTANIKVYSKSDALKTLKDHMDGKPEDRPNINYTQFNIGNQVNSNNTTNNTVQQIDMSDFSDIELKVIRKMSGNQDPAALIELQQIESQYYESTPA